MKEQEEEHEDDEDLEANDGHDIAGEINLGSLDKLDQYLHKGNFFI